MTIINFNKITFFYSTIDKKFKGEILSLNLCIHHIETSKSNFIYVKIINCFYFWILNKCPC